LIHSEVLTNPRHDIGSNGVWIELWHQHKLHALQPRRLFPEDSRLTPWAPRSAASRKRAMSLEW